MNTARAAVIVMLATCLLGAWLLGHRRRRSAPRGAEVIDLVPLLLERRLQEQRRRRP